MRPGRRACSDPVHRTQRFRRRDGQPGSGPGIARRRPPPASLDQAVEALRRTGETCRTATRRPHWRFGALRRRLLSRRAARPPERPSADRDHDHLTTDHPPANGGSTSTVAPASTSTCDVAASPAAASQQPVAQHRALRQRPIEVGGIHGLARTWASTSPSGPGTSSSSSQPHEQPRRRGEREPRWRYQPTSSVANRSQVSTPNSAPGEITTSQVSDASIATGPQRRAQTDVGRVEQHRSTIASKAPATG